MDHSYSKQTKVQTVVIDSQLREDTGHQENSAPAAKKAKSNTVAQKEDRITEVWTVFSLSNEWTDPPELIYTDVVGVYTSREAAIRNAKVKMANSCDLFDDEGNIEEDADILELEDNSSAEDVKFECHGGFRLFKLIGINGDTEEVKMKKSELDSDVVSWDF